MSDSNRIASIDSMRGLLIVLMLFINDFYPQVAQQMTETGVSGINSFNAAGWLLPLFLFIVGLTIPWSINKRLADGQDIKTIARHIVIRTISLLAIGLIMVNSDRVNAEFTGIGKNLWTVIMYFAIFLVLNKYVENDKNFFTIAGLKLAGLAIIVALVFKFKSGQFENNGSLITGSWGYTGIIGWGYLVTAMIYLYIRDNLLNIIVTALFFLLLTILASLDLFTALDSLKPIFGVITEGSVPFMIMSGIITTLLIRKYANQMGMKKIVTIVTIGLLVLITGYILKWVLTAFNNELTPGWTLIQTGINMMLFVIFYWIIEIMEKTKWSLVIGKIGEYSLTTYLLSVALYHLILVTGLPILLYKQSESQLVIAIGSVAWTAIIIVLTKFLVKKGIKLRL